MNPVFLLLQLPVVLTSFMCYQCATDTAVMNWSRYGLPMQQGDSMVGDNLCYFEERVQSNLPCSGLCFTTNVTNELGHTVAVVRDCQYPSHKKLRELAETEDNCITKEIVVRRKTLYVRHCYCKGDFCNGRQPLRRSYRRGSPDGSTSNKIPMSLLLTALLFFH